MAVASSRRVMIASHRMARVRCGRKRWAWIRSARACAAHPGGSRAVPRGRRAGQPARSPRGHARARSGGHARPPRSRRARRRGRARAGAHRVRRRARDMARALALVGVDRVIDGVIGRFVVEDGGGHADEHHRGRVPDVVGGDQRRGDRGLVRHPAGPIGHRQGMTQRTHPRRAGRRPAPGRYGPHGRASARIGRVAVDRHDGTGDDRDRRVGGPQSFEAIQPASDRPRRPEFRIGWRVRDRISSTASDPRP